MISYVIISAPTYCCAEIVTTSANSAWKRWSRSGIGVGLEPCSPPRTLAVNMKTTLKVWRWRPTLLLCLGTPRTFWRSVTQPRCYLCVAHVCQGVSIHNSGKGRGLPLLSANGTFLLRPQTFPQRPVCPQPTRTQQHL